MNSKNEIGTEDIRKLYNFVFKSSVSLIFIVLYFNV
jgi:hypothetical protein